MKQMHNVQENGQDTKQETRTPVYLLFVLDVSGSMNEKVDSEYTRIAYLNKAVKETIISIKSKSLTDENRTILFQIIQFADTSSLVLDRFYPIESFDVEKNLSPLEAKGGTFIKELFDQESVLTSTITNQLRENARNPINIILVSDGEPISNSKGYPSLTESEYTKIINDFKKNLNDRGLKEYVKYSSLSIIASADPFLSVFADENCLYKSTSITDLADKLNFASLTTLGYKTDPGDFEEAKQLFSVEVDNSKCNNCKKCLNACSIRAISFKSLQGADLAFPRINGLKCGFTPCDYKCVSNCPNKALRIVEGS